MKFNNALFLATFALAYGAPASQDDRQQKTEQAMSGYEGSMTNYRQVYDTLNNQLKNNAGHSNQAVINAYITGADSQIDNAIATVSEALAPLTLGLSKAVGDVLLGPFVQSVTNGAEVFLSNVLGGAADVVDDSLFAMITGDYSKLASFAAKNNVDASRLNNINQQLSKLVPASHKGKRDGISGAITNIKQTVDTLTEQLKKNDGHAGKDVVNAVITGLDSQIDNFAATLFSDFNGVTLGLSGDLGDFLLGPFFQSLTNGAEVVISNVIGGSVDIVTDGTAKLFSNALGKLESIGKQYSVSSDKLAKLSDAKKQVDELKPPKKSHHKDKRDGISGAITNLKQTVDTLTEQLKKNDGHAGKDVVNAVITGLDSQVDNFAATLFNGFNGVTLGLSGDLGDFLLGPFFQSLTNGAEVVISNVIGGSVDIVTDGTAKLFSNALGKLESIGKEYSISSDKLAKLSDAKKQVDELQPPKKSHHKDKRDGISGAITNIKQTVDTLTEQLKKNDGHAGKDVVNAVITGLDSQIDNFAATLFSDFNGVTLGLSGDLGDFLLGPFFQSLTNGAEVVISNVIGGSVDIVTDGTAKLFSNALGKLESIGKQYSVSSEKLANLADAKKQVDALEPPKKSHHEHKEKRASDADMSGFKGSMTNYQQTQDTMNHQLQSHNGHAAQAVINAYITGADSQIDNAIATVADALAPVTLGASKAVGDFLLGPFVQSVTNGAEVLISNLIGGSVDAVNGVAVQAYSRALQNLSQAASKYGVDSHTVASLAQTQSKLNSLFTKGK